jgi:butyrate kinase
MKEDIKNCIRGEHASNLGALIADDIAKSLPSAKAYIADPVVVDELQDVARVSGHPRFERVSIFHALNQKAISRQYAKSLDKRYEDLNLIVAHLGGGISVGAHCMGKVIDVNNALDGEGPFSPERSGTVPAGQLAKLCFSGEVTYEEVMKILNGQGGLVAHAGTNDAYEIEMKAKAGDEQATLLQDAMSYNIAKSIGQMAAVLKGRVDGIILTGGIANNPYLVDYVKDMVGFIAPVAVYPGEDEMQALSQNALMALRGDVIPREYV